MQHRSDTRGGEMTFDFSRAGRSNRSTGRSNHTGANVPPKNGASAMRETVTGTGGALKGLKTWLAVSRSRACAGSGASVTARRLMLGVILTIVGVLSIASAPALAVNTHVFSTSFAGPGAGAGQVALSSYSGVAVNSTTHDVYVADTGNFRVDQFTSSGTFVRAWGWGVADGLPMLETCTLSCQIGLSGSEGGQFTTPVFVAVDNSAGPSAGDVYVGDTGDHLVSKFDSSGNLIGGWGSGGQLDGSTATDGPFGHIAGVAVDSGGTLTVINESSRIFEFAQDGGFNTDFEVAPQGAIPSGLAVDATGDLFKINFSGAIEELAASGSDIGRVTTSQATSQAASGVAVESGTGDLYVAESQNDIEHYAFSAPGVVREQGGATCTVEPLVGCPATDVFGRGALSGSAGVAVDPSNHTAYVTDSPRHRIDVFTGPVLLPSATTEPATVSETAATLHGTVNPDGVEVKSCEFEYGTESGVFTKTVPCLPATPYNGSAPLAVSAELNSLVMFTVYHYRLAVSNANGTNRGSEVSFTTPGPPRISNVSAEVNPSEKAGQTTATLSAQVAPGGSETTYRFEYGETTSYGTSTPVPDGALGSGAGFQPVPAAELTGLKLGTTYHYRLVAHNEYGTIDSPDQVFTTLPAVLIKASVSHVTATTATLEAQINPLGNDTHYYFQYGTANCSESPGSCTTTPVPSADIGAGETETQAAPAMLTGLQTATVYHYRVVEENTLGTASTADQTFTTQGTGGFSLPDGRGWELVSPPDKHGANIHPLGETGVIQAAADGSAITYLTNAPTEASPPGNADSAVQVLSARSAGGWSSRDINLPHEVIVGTYAGPGTEYNFFSSDLSQSIPEPLGPLVPSVSSEASEATPYLREDFAAGEPGAICTTSCYRPLVTGKPGFANVPPGTTFGLPGKCPSDFPCGPRFLGASPDASHIILKSESAALVEGAPLGSLYEWTAGRLQLVSVLPGSGGPAPDASFAVLGSENSSGISARNAISADGSRIVWSEAADLTSKHHLYLRDVGKDETLQLDVNHGGSGGGVAEPIFQGASADDSVIFFTDYQQLAPGSGAAKEAADLYRCDVITGGSGQLECALTDLTPANGAESAAVKGPIPGVSEDGSTVYFLAKGVLTHTPNPRGEEPASGRCEGADFEEHPTASCNLYMRHGATTTFIASLAGDDFHDWSPVLPLQPTRVSPDGEWLAFMSERALTGYDNRDVATGKPATEVYLYDAASNQLRCASCDPTGARPHGVEYTRLQNGLDSGGKGTWFIKGLVAANVPGWTSIDEASASRYQDRYLSDSGRLFFNSPDGLVSQDSNGTVDVYEYEPPGVGDCSEASATFSVRSGGCLGLISSGGSGEESVFLDASESGADVFFLTAAQLSKRDTDTSYDVYDARVGGSEPEPVKPVECLGSACQAQVAAPNDPTPGSLSFQGPGNLKPLALDGKSVHKIAAQLKAEKLAKALKACKRDKSKKKRIACEKQARKKYGAAKAKKATNKRRAK